VSDASAAAPTGVAALLAAYRDGTLDPRDAVEEAYARAQAAGRPTWISLLPWAHVSERLEALRSAPPDLPLRGVPFAAKDNLDVAGAQTTAGCPAFAYTPAQSAAAVVRLVHAGAIPIGKTNLDQFATGLTGTRSPYGACASVVEPRLISGGSSSRSAVAVADGTVPFALGTDTAGSGRVPAAFNGIVGHKPTRGLVSTRGSVPARLSLDCVSIFAREVGDAARVLEVMTHRDPLDPYARSVAALPAAGPAPRVAVPRAGDLDFVGDAGAARAWDRLRATAAALAWELVEVDVEAFVEAGRLMYDGPWVAERYAAMGAFIARHREGCDETVARIVLEGATARAADLFAAMHRLAALSRAADAVWATADALLLPTAPTVFTHAQVAEEPVARNSVLGTYTNFANLLDCCGVAVPGPARDDGLPFGVTLYGPAGADRRVLDLAARWSGAAPYENMTAPASVALAVVGAHLSGEPLNGELLHLGARLRETTRTAGGYRLYALPGTVPAKPGLVAGGADAGPGIEVEVYDLSPNALGRLMAAVPAPLTIGTITLADGRAVKGFLCEAHAVRDAADITHHAGWRAYRAAGAGADDKPRLA
jgi:allophanate hydrolase